MYMYVCTQYMHAYLPLACFSVHDVSVRVCNAVHEYLSIHMYSTQRL